MSIVIDTACLRGLLFIVNVEALIMYYSMWSSTVASLSVEVPYVLLPGYTDDNKFSTAGERTKFSNLVLLASVLNLVLEYCRQL